MSDQTPQGYVRSGKRWGDDNLGLIARRGQST